MSTSARAVEIAILVLDQNISFNAPFTRVKVEVEAMAPLVSAAVEIITARPEGAAWTELAEIAVVRTEAGTMIPRLWKNMRIFSIERSARLRTAHSLRPS